MTSERDSFYINPPRGRTFFIFDLQGDLPTHYSGNYPIGFAHRGVGRALRFDLGGPSHYSGNYPIRGFEHCAATGRTNLPGGSLPRTRARPVHAKPPRRGSRLARETGPAHARPHAPTVFTTSEVVTHARSATRNIARQRTSSAPSPCCGRRRRLLNKAQRALACPSSLPDASLLTTSANSPFFASSQRTPYATFLLPRLNQGISGEVVRMYWR
jgi:hypothetical protein